MTKKKETTKLPVAKTDDRSVHTGSTNHGRILDESPRAKSKRHRCKGPQCVDAFKNS